MWTEMRRALYIPDPLMTTEQTNVLPIDREKRKAEFVYAMWVERANAATKDSGRAPGAAQ